MRFEKRRAAPEYLKVQIFEGNTADSSPDAAAAGDLLYAA